MHSPCSIAVRSFFRSAFEDDMFPLQGVDEIVGCPMDDGIGSLTFNAWKTLWLHEKITEWKRRLVRGACLSFLKPPVAALAKMALPIPCAFVAPRSQCVIISRLASCLARSHGIELRSS